MQKEQIIVQKPRAYGKSMYWDMVKKMMNTYYDNVQYSLTPQPITLSEPPSDKDVISVKYNIGIDLGREDNMCTDSRIDYEKEELRETVTHLKQNHLGATTERFIAMAREGGRSEHLGNKVREQDQKIYELSQALMRANEQVAYSDNETQKASNRAQAWQERAIKAENLYYGLREKNRAAAKKAKKPVAKKK